MTSAEWRATVADALGVAWTQLPTLGVSWTQLPTLAYEAHGLIYGRVRVMDAYMMITVSCHGAPSSGREGGAGGLGGSVWLGGDLPEPVAFARAVRALDAGDPAPMRALGGTL